MLFEKVSALGRRFAADKSGNIAIVFAFMSVIAFGSTGLAVDYGRALNAKTQLQVAADAAAISAASQPNLTDSERISLAQQLFRQNRINSSLVASVEANITADARETGKAIKITANIELPTTIAAAIGYNTMPISVESQAMLGTGLATVSGPACLLALEQSDYGIKINGGSDGSHITANCGVYANSQSQSAIFGNNKGTLTSSYACVHGDYDLNPTYAPTPIKGCPRLSDPLAGQISAPNASGCDYDKTKVNGNRTATLNPGIYCGGIDIGSSAVVTFNPGVYVIKGGQFNIGSSAVVTGDGVFFYLTDGNARLDWGSHSEVTFKAPTSGTYKGMLVWAKETLSNAHRIGCHAQSILQGTVYSPTTEIDIQSSGDVGASADWTVWVVKSVQLSSSAHLKIKSNFTGSATPLPDGLVTRLTPPKSPARLL